MTGISTCWSQTCLTSVTMGSSSVEYDRAAPGSCSIHRRTNWSCSLSPARHQSRQDIKSKLKKSESLNYPVPHLAAHQNRQSSKYTYIPSIEQVHVSSGSAFSKNVIRTRWNETIWAQLALALRTNRFEYPWNTAMRIRLQLTYTAWLQMYLSFLTTN